MIERTPDICRFETTITVDCSPLQLYEQWCDHGLWPPFTRQVTSSSCYDVLTISRIPVELVQWRTMDGAPVPYAAEAWFHESRDGHATDLQIIISWMDARGARLETSLSEDKIRDVLIGESLVHFKQQMEHELSVLAEARSA